MGKHREIIGKPEERQRVCFRSFSAVAKCSSPSALVDPLVGLVCLLFAEEEVQGRGCQGGGRVNHRRGWIWGQMATDGAAHAPAYTTTTEQPTEQPTAQLPKLRFVRGVRLEPKKCQLSNFLSAPRRTHHRAGLGSCSVSCSVGCSGVVQ